MHFLTIVMALKQKHIEKLLEPYNDDATYRYEYADCHCTWNSPNHLPNPRCPECEGTGKELVSSSGPDAHWDWYEPEQSEGRWADYIIPMTPEEAKGEHSGLPFAIVTPEDGWNENPGNKDDDNTWEERYWDIFNRAINKGYKPFVVDCHD